VLFDVIGKVHNTVIHAFPGFFYGYRAYLSRLHQGALEPDYRIGGTLKRQRGFTFTLMRGKEKVLGEVGLMFIGYNLSRCISVLGTEKLIRALRECCLSLLLRIFGHVLSLFKLIKVKCKSLPGYNDEKKCLLNGRLLNSYALSLIGI